MSLKACYQVGTVRRTSNDGEIASGFSQRVGDIGDALSFVAGRIGGVEANKPLKHLHRVGADAIAFLSG